MSNICNICDKHYSSYQSLCIHNKKFHIIKSAKNQHVISIKSAENQHVIADITIDKNLCCKYCNKLYKHIQSRWRHEQYCDKKNTNKIEAKINELEKEIIKLKKDNKKPTTKIINKVQGNLINGNNHDSGPKQIIYKTGASKLCLSHKAQPEQKI
jgi:hypothetical protein